MKQASISPDEVKHLAKLAHLELSDAQLGMYSKDVDDIVAFMNQIKDLEIDDMPETSRTTNEQNVLRDDVVLPSLSQEDALSGAPKVHNGYFVVSHVLAEKEE